MLQRLENTKRVQRGFVVAPAAKGVKNAFALFVTSCSFFGTLGGLCGAFQRHDCAVGHKSISYNHLFCHRIGDHGFEPAHRSEEQAAAIFSTLNVSKSKIEAPAGKALCKGSTLPGFCVMLF